ncbi:hypothetical protein FOCC_FOCC017193 [Frankliniella occidentalis]|nr:hypothetical protein FOCC_FOCC017193 [Frankliniella occidentalis]
MRVLVLCLLSAAAAAVAEVPEPSPVTLGLDSGEAAAGRSQDETQERRYDGHVVLRVVPRTSADLDALDKILVHDSEVDVWRPASRAGEEVHICVPPWRLDGVVGDLESHGLQQSVMIRNVQGHIDNQTQSDVGRDRHGEFGFDNFYRIDTIYSWMYKLAKRSGGVASVVKGGLTSEGRHILGVRVAHAPDLPVVILEGGVHGREWASTAAAAFVLDQLVAGEDPEVRRLARSYEWHVFPSVNPDGYEYSHTTVCTASVAVN